MTDNLVASAGVADLGTATAGVWLNERDVKERLAERGVAVPAGARAADADAAGTAASRLRAPLVVKLAAPSLVHKSEIGGVVLGVQTATAVADTAASLLAVAKEHGLARADLIIEEQLPGGVELIVGALRDENFGTVVTVGLGGIWVELLSDVAIGLAPLSPDDVERMLRSLRAWPLLAGHRGRPPVDLNALRALVMAVGGPSGLALEPGCDQLDLNPVIARPDGVVVVDAKLHVTEHVQASAPAPAVVAARCSDGSLDRLFKPGLVVMIGASSSDSSKTANAMLRAYRDARGERPLLCVHPAAAKGLEAIEGVPCVPSLDAVEDDVDLLVLAVSVAQIPNLLRSAAGKVKVAHVMASPPEEPVERAATYVALLDAACAAGIRLVGPNCLGSHCPAGAISWLSGISLRPGGASVITQSGGFGGNMISLGSTERLRFAKLLSIGDSIDVGGPEVLGYLLDDPETTCIGMHVETARGARELYEQISSREQRKPIVMLKTGRTQAGGRAAQSHTGALMGDARLWRAFESQAGVTIASSLQEFVAAMKFFERHHDAVDEPAPAALLLGSSGGFSVMGADALVSAGIQMPPLSAEGKARAAALLGPPVGETYDNPFDMLRGSGSYETIAGMVLETERLTDIVLHMRLDLLYIFAPDPDSVVRDFTDAVGRLPTAFPGTRFSAVLQGSKRSAPVAELAAEALADSRVALFDSFEDLAVGMRAAAIHARRWYPPTTVGELEAGARTARPA
jgi:acyl-CoA synthetase (NDP forming)